jgi:hypothetical protein
MSNPNECDRCANGESPRIVRETLCLLCGKAKPIKEVIDGICNDCLEEYRKAKIEGKEREWVNKHHKKFE